MTTRILLDQPAAGYSCIAFNLLYSVFKLIPSCRAVLGLVAVVVLENLLDVLQFQIVQGDDLLHWSREHNGWVRCWCDLPGPQARWQMFGRDWIVG